MEFSGSQKWLPLFILAFAITQCTLLAIADLPGTPAIEEIPETVRYGEAFDVFVSVPLSVVGILEVNLGNAPFATHSFSQGQRLVKLTVTPSVPDSAGRYRIGCTAPPNTAVAPPGYYMAFVVNQGVPSVARWVHLVA
ncbi:hypothetical protein Q3G72_028474 [Acer saccharum]|nr:hypothetical protein Q3G72_028474 [Acer saccharum]